MLQCSKNGWLEYTGLIECSNRLIVYPFLLSEQKSTYMVKNENPHKNSHAFVFVEVITKLKKCMGVWQALFY